MGQERLAQRGQVFYYIDKSKGRTRTPKVSEGGFTVHIIKYRQGLQRRMTKKD
jgi:hypothetical protein